MYGFEPIFVCEFIRIICTGCGMMVLLLLLFDVFCSCFFQTWTCQCMHGPRMRLFMCSSLHVQISMARDSFKSVVRYHCDVSNQKKSKKFCPQALAHFHVTNVYTCSLHKFKQLTTSAHVDTQITKKMYTSGSLLGRPHLWENDCECAPRHPEIRLAIAPRQYRLG